MMKTVSLMATRTHPTEVKEKQAVLLCLDGDVFVRAQYRTSFFYLSGINHKGTGHVNCTNYSEKKRTTEKHSYKAYTFCVITHSKLAQEFTRVVQSLSMQGQNPETKTSCYGVNHRRI